MLHERAVPIAPGPLIGITLGSPPAPSPTFLALAMDTLRLLSPRFQGSVPSVHQGQYEALRLVTLVAVGVLALGRDGSTGMCVG